MELLLTSFLSIDNFCNSSAGAVADEPILRILLHLLIVFKPWLYFFSILLGFV